MYIINLIHEHTNFKGLQLAMCGYIPYGFHSALQVLDRGEKIELLVDKTENLRSQVGRCMSS